MLISKGHLNLYKPSLTILVEQRLYSITLSEEDKKKKEKGITVFISHKHDEQDILRKVISLLVGLGADLYLDWLDEEMPSKTSGETAEKLKSKIEKNKKFILIATEAAISSKWCNWELGFGDAKKFHKHIAVMPIAENDGKWNGNEYLQIYPIIKNNYEKLPFDYYVEYKDKIISLEDWLKS